MLDLDNLSAKALVVDRSSIATYQGSLVELKHLTLSGEQPTHQVSIKQVCVPVFSITQVTMQIEPEWVSLRSLLDTLGQSELYPLFKAAHLTYWLSQNQFCGRCGGASQPQFQPDLKVSCPKCHHQSYPKIQPCVIVAITRGDQILLAKNSANKRGFYSLIAGFVEPGESLEAAARREIKEETGLEVGRVNYLGSQPWPFPMNLMVGFQAEYSSGEIYLEDQELSDAGFYDREQLPLLAPKGSIARRIIDHLLYDNPLDL